MGPDVASTARIGVLPPGPAHPIGLFQNDEVVDASLLERDRHAEPGEAGAHDDYRVGALAHGGSSGLQVVETQDTFLAYLYQGPDRLGRSGRPSRRVRD